MVKKMISILAVFAAFCGPLFLSCSNDDSDNHLNPVYDLRPLTRVFEEFDVTIESPDLRMNRKKPSGHMSVSFGKEMRPGLHSALSRESAGIEETLTFTYGNNAHLYWTEAIGKDADGSTVATAAQTLDDAGFPTRTLWYDGEGSFRYGYDYTYDETLYLKTSVICYQDDPTNNPGARRYYENASVWSKDGVLTTKSEVEYDSEGIKIFEGKWRSTTLRNTLRGAGGYGFWEEYRQYEEGRLTYQDEITSNQDGYPETWRIDENGDGTFELVYYAEITKTPEGYLESVTWLEEGTDNKYMKTTIAYNNKGLLKNTKDYYWENDEFLLAIIITDTWYQNPVNGPTGGIHVFFQSDEAGDPVAAYETVDWTETLNTHHYFSAPGEKSMRITESLEKIRLQ